MVKGLAWFNLHATRRLSPLRSKVDEVLRGTKEVEEKNASMVRLVNPT